SHLNFEAVKQVLQTSMSDKQTDILFNLIHCASSGKDQFTLTNHDEAVKLWDLALVSHTSIIKFIKDKVTAPYKNVDRTFEIHYHLLWDWALDLLNDEHLVPHFEWDVCKLFKFNGEEWVQCFNEPWT
ncbi:hypothetical protein BJV74DRAFT_789349, partial [Russula compacta]